MKNMRNLLLSSILLCGVFVAKAQQTNEPIVIREQTEQIQLADVHQLDDSILLDLRYATANNITNKKIYRVARCLLVRPAAEALIRVNARLKKRGLVLKIFDAYRPHSAQKLLWAILPDDRYVANPQKGSRHNRGCAVDLTLCDLKTGKELAMPTEFDDFSEKAHRNHSSWSEEVAKNSQLLEREMAKEEFTGLATEWWHFDYQGWRNYPLLDIPLEKF